MQVTIASFNLNNLFSRFDWSGTAARANAGVVYLQRDKDGNETELPDVEYVVERRADDRRRVFRGRLIGEKDPAMTLAVAQRINAMDADVLLVQEVEDQRALEDFNRDHLSGRYGQVMVIDGNDPRFIDVGILVRGALHLGRVTTWKHARHRQRPDDPQGIFSRDLLEVELLDSAGTHRLTVFNTHLKSHFVDEWNQEEHRKKTAAEIAAEHHDADERRRQQAETASTIISARIGEPMLVAGDMNDPPDSPAFVAWPALGLSNALEHAAETQPPPPAPARRTRRPRRDGVIASRARALPTSTDSLTTSGSARHWPPMSARR